MELAAESGIAPADVAQPASLAALKSHYRTGVDDLARAFFAPCLREATGYRRAAGYFSSTALLTWMEALPRLVKGDDLTVQLIASPELSVQDKAVLRELVSEEKRAEYRRVLVERMLEEIIKLAENPGDDGVRARIFAWLLANERLEIRFCVREPHRCARHLPREDGRLRIPERGSCRVHRLRERDARRAPPQLRVDRRVPKLGGRR